ncbi:MAG TPA: S41 family peptidase, partial [Pyrinomonadaceae bacterium]|nr:S41 family peptidase [Pyrinomonadaceae bacterium]
AEERRELSWMNHGFNRVERLRGNVGYIEFNGFMDAEAGAEAVAAAMNFVANTDALIIDLRKNGGGNPEMVALVCSYLFGPEPVHLNDLYWREGNRTQEFWTRKEVAGRRYLNKDVYVLTSKRTFSGAEEFSYNLKNLKRATIVGETTGGGAHPGGGVRVNEHFMMFVPRGRAISPVTKTNWEGTGVKPDVEVPAEQALTVAHLAALRKSLPTLPNPGVKAAVQGLIDQMEKELGETKAKK